MPTLVATMVVDLTTSLRGRGTEPGTTEEATVGWSGMARPQPDICLLVRRFRLFLLSGNFAGNLLHIIFVVHAIIHEIFKIIFYFEFPFVKVCNSFFYYFYFSKRQKEAEIL